MGHSSLKSYFYNLIQYSHKNCRVLCNAVELQGMAVPGKQRDLQPEKRFCSLLKPLNVIIKEIAADICKKTNQPQRTRRQITKQNQAKVENIDTPGYFLHCKCCEVGSSIFMKCSSWGHLGAAQTLYTLSRRFCPLAIAWGGRGGNTRREKQRRRKCSCSLSQISSSLRADGLPLVWGKENGPKSVTSLTRHCRICKERVLLVTGAFLSAWSHLLVPWDIACALPKLTFQNVFGSYTWCGKILCPSLHPSCMISELLWNK